MFGLRQKKKKNCNDLHVVIQNASEAFFCIDVYGVHT